MSHLLICAMDSEADGFRAMLKNRTDERVGGLVFSSGLLAEKPVVVVKCGVGKVNASLCAQGGILQYHPSAVINVGVAGGVGTGIVTGHVVLGTQTVQYDFDLTAIGEDDGLFYPCDGALTESLAVAARKVFPEDRLSLGVIATGDRFVGDSATATLLREKHSALACEMEGGAIAQVCALAGVPCAVLRAISDNANEHSNVDFPTFLASAVSDTEKIILSYFEDLV